MKKTILLIVVSLLLLFSWVLFDQSPTTEIDAPSRPVPTDEDSFANRGPSNEEEGIGDTFLGPGDDKPSLDDLPDSALVDLLLMDNSFSIDVKYATSDNFTGKVLYDCEQCLLRKVVADSLISAHKYFQSLGYKLKIFDCYRPLSVQKKMWEIVPDDKYVANPEKGSMHNRGGAVDLTLVDMATGEELDMGSPFDHFGRESHHAYPNLTDEVKNRRLFLKETLTMFGFEPITSEWWHYSYRGKFYNVLDKPLLCH